MAERKIRVPEGMLKAVAERWPIRCMEDNAHVTATLEDGLRWISENPIAPSNKDMDEFSKRWPHVGQTVLFEFADWFQRRMFLAPEPEVPEEIKDLFWECPGGDGRTQYENYASKHYHQVIEAFRRGQRSK